jgi:hypothetical protein
MIREDFVRIVLAGLYRQEKFLYVCDTLEMWERDVLVLDIQEAVEGNHAPVCVGGRRAAPPEFSGGPTGYRLMLKRQREGAAMSDPVRLEAGYWGATEQKSSIRKMSSNFLQGVGCVSQRSQFAAAYGFWK